MVVGAAKEVNKSIFLICFGSARHGSAALDVKNISLKPWDIVKIQTFPKDCVERLETIEGAKYYYMGEMLSPLYLVKRSKSKLWY